MKLCYLFCLIGCLSNSAEAQHLQGTYYSVTKERGFSSELFQFTGSRFYFIAFGCTGLREGRGTFAVRKDYLLLYCEKMVTDTAVATSLLADTAAVPTFHFRVLGKATGTPLPGATIASRAKRIGTSTDSAGQARITYLPPTGDQLAVSFVGYQRVAVPLCPAVSQRFTVRMGPPYYFAAGDTLVFQLKQVRPNSFAYRLRLDADGSDDDKIPYSHSKRISAAAASKLMQGQ